MFTPREVFEAGQFPAGGGTAVLSVPAPAWPARIAALGQKLRAADPARIDWAPDLAEAIGSARWLRGLATMLGLSACAIAFWPDFSAITAAPAMRLDAAARDEVRSAMIMPLALGGDTGRRMGPTAALVPLAAAPERASVALTATLAQGDSLASMLERAGASPGDIARSTQLIAAKVPLGEIEPGTQFDLRLGKRLGTGGARSLDHLAFRARFDLDLALDRGGAGLVLKARQLRVDTTPLRIRGTVGTSIYRAARAAGAPIEAIQQYLSVLDQHLNLDTEIQSGDTFDFVVSSRRSAGGESQFGELLYAGLERGGKPEAQLLRWGKDGQFFEASGMGAQRSGLIMPVVGHVTSGFGMRHHPLLGYTRLHAGIDFGAAYGSPIYAVGDGTVNFAGWHGGHGNYVKVDHGGGFATGYGHMSRIAVSPGTRVHGGQVIGYVGSTGLSTGPHLHYELWKNGVPVNPMTERFTVNNQVDAHELAAFRARLAAMKAVQPGAALTSLAPRGATPGASGPGFAKLD